MSHLGDLASALVDGELTGAERDRVNAHLAACAGCRAEAAQLRRLKSELRALAEVDAPEAGGAAAVTRRLLAMPGPRDPLGSLPPGSEHSWPIEPIEPSGPAGRRRGRYAVWGAVSLVVAGVGAAAFGMGGSSAPPERPATPQLEMLDLQHAVTSGDVLFAGPRKMLATAAARP